MKSSWKVVAGVVAALVLGAFVAIALVPGGIGERLLAWAQRPNVEGGPQVVLEVEPDGVELGQAVEESIKIIERRLYDLGTRGVVEQQGADRILVQLPRSADLKRSIEMMTRRSKLEFRLIDATMTAEEAIAGRPPRRSEILYGRGDRIPYLVEKQVLLSGRDLTDAQPGFDPRSREPVLNFRFNSSGARTFGRVTQENVGRPFAIVFDREVLAAPVIREPILGGAGQISGNFTVQQVNDMAILLRAGELPGRLRVIEERGP